MGIRNLSILKPWDQPSDEDAKDEPVLDSPQDS